MGIKLVVNGYFRSGTTAIWAELKRSNPGYKVLYEPCHEKLPLILDSQIGKVEKLHGKSLWDEYGILDIRSTDIRRVHPNIGSVFPSNSLLLKGYLQYFEHFDDNLILQTNRWHEFLGVVRDITEAKVVHVIRNPFDVYLSFKQSIYKDTSGPSKAVSFFKNHVFGYDFFYVDELYKFTKSRTSKGDTYYQGAKRRAKDLVKRRLEKFFYCWLFYNACAIEDCERRGGKVFLYENLANGTFENYLKEYGISFDSSNMHSKRDIGINEEEKKWLESFALSNGLRYEIFSILNFIDV